MDGKKAFKKVGETIITPPGKQNSTHGDPKANPILLKREPGGGTGESLMRENIDDTSTMDSQSRREVKIVKLGIGS